ncbi:MAG: hypothetical protein HC779_02120, partial [Phyllobacteriaceae bacterium]|nr:hypothetical protein [Phyllobacteriaceae bacterium]
MERRILEGNLFTTKRHAHGTQQAHERVAVVEQVRAFAGFSAGDWAFGGGIEAGPNAVLALAREDMASGSSAPPIFRDALTYRGLWKFLGETPPH